MHKRLIASAAVAAVFVSVNPAIAEGGGATAYYTAYYSDASHQTQVGASHWSGCRQGGDDEALYYLEGIQTVYYTQLVHGYCIGGEAHGA